VEALKREFGGRASARPRTCGSRSLCIESAVQRNPQWPIKLNRVPNWPFRDRAGRRATHSASEIPLFRRLDHDSIRHEIVAAGDGQRLIDFRWSDSPSNNCCDRHHCRSNRYHRTCRRSSRCRNSRCRNSCCRISRRRNSRSHIRSNLTHTRRKGTHSRIRNHRDSHSHTDSRRRESQSRLRRRNC